MSEGTTVAAQLGFKAETTYGTHAGSLDHWLPILPPEGLKKNIEILKSKAIRAGRIMADTNDWAQGGEDVQGPLNFELYDRSCTLLFVHALGSASVTGSNPYTHTISPGTLTGKSLTIQVGKPMSNGTVTPHNYLGAKIRSWTLTGKTGEFCKLSLDIMARNEETSTALGTASYTSGLAPMTFIGATITIGGTSQTGVRDFTLTSTNSYVERPQVGSAFMLEPLEGEVRDISGTINLEYSSTTNYGLYTAGTEGAVVFTIARGSNLVKITLNCRFEGETPAVNDAGVIVYPVKFVADASTDPGAITIVCVNGDSAP